MKLTNIFLAISKHASSVRMATLFGAIIGLAAIFSRCFRENMHILRNPKGLFLDSLRIQKNALSQDTFFTGESVCAAYQDGVWFLVASCNVHNPCEDTILFRLGAPNTLDCIENLLYDESRNYYLKPASCFRGHYFSTQMDTFLPSAQKSYCIPFFATPKLAWGSSFYADVSVAGKILGKKAYTPERYGIECDTLFHFLLYINIQTNQIRYVDSTFEQIIERYKAQGGKQVPHPDW